MELKYLKINERNLIIWKQKGLAPRALFWMNTKGV